MVATTHFWRCLRCRLLHFTIEAPTWCEHCGYSEFILVLVGISASDSSAPLVPTAA